MKIVDEATMPPGMCLASRDMEGPFIDTGLQARHHDPYIYISVRWLKEQARELGMVPEEEVDARFSGLERELQEYADQLARLQRLADATAEFSEAAQAVGADLPPLTPPVKVEFHGDDREHEAIEQEVAA